VTALVPNLLEVNDLDAYYGPFQALFGTSLTVAEGEIVAVIGANDRRMVAVVSGSDPI
jgi:ABC-type branched-subunit amino acid transport system ATPase component